MREVPVAADAVLAAVLAGPRASGRVVVATPHAAYARVGAALVGLLAPAAVRVPGGLVVPADLVAAVRPGEPVVVGDGAALVAGARLVVARWWDSVVPSLRRPVPACEPADLEQLDVGGGPELPDAVGVGADALAAALAAGADAGPAIAGLVGLGPGLTPAGDDVVAGVLVALVAGGVRDRAGAVLAGVRPCLHRTTSLSAALLEHAAAGRAVPQLARYLHDPRGAGTLAGLLRVGGTSGAALARGARIGLSVAAGGKAATMGSSRDREVA